MHEDVDTIGDSSVRDTVCDSSVGTKGLNFEEYNFAR